MKKFLLCFVLASACGGDDAGELFTPKPECMGDAVTPYAGTFAQAISKLSVGEPTDGFDLNHDGIPDNKLSGVESIAMTAVEDAVNSYNILVPIEFFDFPTVGKDSCVKFAVYTGVYALDEDGDGNKASVDKGDCNDHDAAIRNGAAEVPGDGKDNDCDGLADENGDNVPSSSQADSDGDNHTIEMGDCDDNNAAVYRGHAEICHDGLDNDCDGFADRTKGSTGMSTSCNPYDGTEDIHLEAMSVDGGAPRVAFKDGTVDGNNKLVAGPSQFQVKIPLPIGFTLDLRLTGATIEATVAADGTMSGGLGGVIDVQTADTIRGLTFDQIGLKPENSLLDATFGNSLGVILSLPKAGKDIQQKYTDCRTPDIDVDGDGLEAFCDSNPNDAMKIVDVCIDGDGTEIRDEGEVQCTTAMKDGKPRFVDGISAKLNFSTSKLKSIQPPM